MLLLFAVLDAVIAVQNYAVLFIPAYVFFTFLLILYIFLIPAFMDPKIMMGRFVVLIFLYFAAAIAVLSLTVTKLEGTVVQNFYVILPFWTAITLHFVIGMFQYGVDAVIHSFLILMAGISVMVYYSMDQSVDLPWSYAIIPLVLSIPLPYLLVTSKKKPE